MRLQAMAATCKGVRQGHGLLRRRRGRAAVCRDVATRPDGHIAPLHPDAPGLERPECVTLIDGAHARRPVLRVVG